MANLAGSPAAHWSPDRMSAKSRGAERYILAARLLSLGLAAMTMGGTAGATNCFSVVDESQWSLIINHNPYQAAISLTVAGGGPEVLTCLRRQPEAVYRILLLGDAGSQQFLHPTLHVWVGSTSRLLATPPPFFPYLIYGGRYRLAFALCGTAGHTSSSAGSCNSSEEDDSLVYSDYVNLQPEVRPHCSPAGFEGNASLIETDTPTVGGMKVIFRFAFSPCSPVQPYDEVNVTLYSSARREECGTVGAAPVMEDRLQLEKSTNGQDAIVAYQTPELEGNHFYCLSASLSHISCKLSTVVEPPNHCWLRSDPVWVVAVPPIGLIIPVCQTHLACAWLYIAVTGTLLFLVSLLLALVCVRGCDRRREAKARAADEVDFSGDVVELGPVGEPRARSWAHLHADWEAREDKARAKILLLYSPDTKLFKELQAALKSFLQLACHSDVYDLFDDALFDTIAVDPSEWLEKFVNDRDVKIIVISSIGAYRRQMALQGQMPLNLPENTLLDGLFTSGLRFVSTYPGLATGSGRVATARYEMLHLTEEGHRLLPPVGGNREFLIPTQLHELFCWLHQLQPLDLMGKPWDHYHLELQLLQDALRLARRDRTLVSGTSGMANGLTLI